MSEQRTLRPLAEGALIVVSILLAFGLEASWSAWVERQEADALLSAIRADLVANRQVVEEALEFSESLASKQRAILRGLSEGLTGAARDSVLSTLGGSFIWKLWDPVNDTYTEAVASGRLALISDPQLRLELTRYQRRIDATNDLAAATRAQYFADIEPFLISHTVYSDLNDPFWSAEMGVPTAPYSTDFAALASSRELWSILTMALQMEVSWQFYLSRVESHASAVMDLLPERGPPAG
jgi:hypothetical protein